MLDDIIGKKIKNNGVCNKGFMILLDDGSVLAAEARVSIEVDDDGKIVTYPHISYAIRLPSGVGEGDKKLLDQL